MRTPQDVIDEAMPQMDLLMKQFELKVNPIKTGREHRKIYWKDVLEQEKLKMRESQQEKYEEGKDNEEMKQEVLPFEQEIPKQISYVNPIQDFNLIFENG